MTTPAPDDRTALSAVLETVDFLLTSTGQRSASTCA
jgi:hypothetical protein